MNEIKRIGSDPREEEQRLRDLILYATIVEDIFYDVAFHQAADFSEATEHYSLDRLKGSYRQIVERYIENIKVWLDNTLAVERGLEEGEPGKDIFNRVFGETKGKVDYQRYGQMVVVRVYDRRDYVVAYNDGAETEDKESFGDAFFQDATIRIGDRDFSFPLIVMDGTKDIDQREEKKVVRHEMQHFFYDILYRRDRDNYFPEEEIKDEILAYIADGRRTDFAAGALTGELYKKVFNDIEDSERREEIKSMIPDIFQAIQEAEELGISRMRLALILSPLLIERFASMIRKINTHYQGR